MRVYLRKQMHIKKSKNIFKIIKKLFMYVDISMFIIIRAHEGEYTFMNDLDDAPDTINISPDISEPSYILRKENAC